MCWWHAGKRERHLLSPVRFAGANAPLKVTPLHRIARQGQCRQEAFAGDGGLAAA